MSHALIARGKDLRGRIASFLLILGLALIWHNGAGARSQGPREETGGLSAAIHPDEGLRQVAHLLQKRVDDRASGALPDPVILSCETAGAAPCGTTRRIQAMTRPFAPQPPAPGPFARAPPLRAVI